MELVSNPGEPITAVQWLDEKTQSLNSRLLEADLARAEALDDNDSMVRFRMEREMAVIQECQMHLNELWLLLDLPGTDNAAALREHQADLTAQLTGQNKLSDQLRGHIDLRGSFKAGTEAAKLRAKVADTIELLNILDK